MKINLDENVPGCLFIKWREVLFCSEWGCHVFPTRKQYINLIKISFVVDQLRIQLDSPVIFTSGLRPTIYNQFIDGAKYSGHINGDALDFYFTKYKWAKGCDTARTIILPQLPKLKVRMENKPGSNWIHLDRKPGSNLFFKP